MSRTNVPPHRPPVRTHEGGPAFAHMTPEQALRRSVMSCLLWENEFYEDGVTIAARISELAGAVSADTLGRIAVEARTKMNLRHVPLLLVLALLQRKDKDGYASGIVDLVVRRADEMAELLALYWKDGKRPLAKQLKVGLDRAVRRFDEYQLAKYDRDGAVKLRDVLRMIRPKPDNDVQAQLWRRAVKGELKTPDTWEVALSGGANKREVFERLLRNGALGYLALLRNLRNMDGAGVDADLVTEAILARRGGAEKVLPFRYVAAARAAPRFEPYLDVALLDALKGMQKLPGRTLVLVDVSGSMDEKLSGKSDLSRLDAAATLAAIVPAQDCRVFTFSSRLVEVPRRLGMAGIDAIRTSQPHGGTYLGEALHGLSRHGPVHRLIVITDEQSADAVGKPDFAERAYLINVASARNGVGYGPWTHIDGFSENVLRWIGELEGVPLGDGSSED